MRDSCKEKVLELDIMKFWGILLVVLGHITNMYTPSGIIQPYDKSEHIAYVSYFIYQFHMPMFVFVSGCVYAFQCEILKRKYAFGLLVKKKSVRLLVPYAFFGLLLVAFMVGLGLRDSTFDYLYQGILLSKDSRHLWYVLMLFEVFLLFWVIAYGVEKLRFPQWSLLIIAFLFYLFASKVPYVLQLGTSFQYLFWFSLGYVFILYKDVVDKFLSAYLVGLVMLILGVLYSHQHYFHIPFISAILAITGILFIYHLSCDFKSISRYRLYQLISENSFGIYLYHVFVVYFLFFLFKDVNIPAYLMSFLSFMSSLLISIFLTQLTRKMGLGVIIGERK